MPPIPLFTFFAYRKIILTQTDSAGQPIYHQRLSLNKPPHLMPLDWHPQHRPVWGWDYPKSPSEKLSHLMRLISSHPSTICSCSLPIGARPISDITFSYRTVVTTTRDRSIILDARISTKKSDEARYTLAYNFTKLDDPHSQRHTRFQTSPTFELDL